MKKFKISYHYLATGMEGIPDERPEEIIEAENEDAANYEYHKKHWDSYAKYSFEEFMNQERYERYWGMSITETC